ncbi:uncharacterized protein LOC143880705 [Tasmannia lanceolata]|uniref:uncharacterized protein LOC143880705 n=1 Tax=Tasmannia lanceolata TaxID=3420 RepID=UPI0040630780
MSDEEVDEPTNYLGDALGNTNIRQPMEADEMIVGGDEVNVIVGPEDFTVGAMFPNLKVFQKKVTKYAIRHRFVFVPQETNPTKYGVRFKDRTCPWRIRGTTYTDYVKNFISAGRDVITIESDRMKGLLRAVAEALLGSHHFYCIHHLSANFHGKFKSEDLQKFFMNAAYSLREGAFKDAMETESFNALLKGARELPIAALIEQTRWRLSDFFQYRQKAGSKWTTRLTPNAEDWLADERILAGGYMAHQCGWTVYEVKSKYHVDEVDLEKKTCTCRLFQTMGMSCSHAIVAMGLDQRDPYSYCEEWYHADTYRRTYDGAIYPTLDRSQWPELTHPLPLVLPPKSRRRRGRPKK